MTYLAYNHKLPLRTSCGITNIVSRSEDRLEKSLLREFESLQPYPFYP